MAWNRRRLLTHLGLMHALLSLPAVTGCSLPGRVDCSAAGSATGNPLGNTTEFSLSNGSGPEGITQGPGSSVWFAEGDQSGSITPAGMLTLYPLNQDSACLSGYCGAYTLATGPDGNLWFSDFTLANAAKGSAATSRIGRITPKGEFLPEVQIPGGGPAYGMTAGPDGAVWFTDEDGNAIGRITLTGQLTEFPLPYKQSFPNAMTLGPDGNLWFTETDGNRIGRITPTGAITEYPVPSPIVAIGCEQSGPGGITAGPDGNLWFTELSNSKLGRITVAGKVTELPLPTAHSRPYDITSGPDGALWFTEAVAGKIGHLRL